MQDHLPHVFILRGRRLLFSHGVYALTAQGDPNVGAIEGEDFLVCFEARATPAAARDLR